MTCPCGQENSHKASSLENKPSPNMSNTKYSQQAICISFCVYIYIIINNKRQLIWKGVWRNMRNLRVEWYKQFSYMKFSKTKKMWLKYVSEREKRYLPEIMFAFSSSRRDGTPWAPPPSWQNYIYYMKILYLFSMAFSYINLLTPSNFS